MRHCLARNAKYRKHIHICVSVYKHTFLYMHKSYLFIKCIIGKVRYIYRTMVGQLVCVCVCRRMYTLYFVVAGEHEVEEGEVIRGGGLMKG